MPNNMPPVQQPAAMQNDRLRRPTDRTLPEQLTIAAQRYFGRYYFIIDFFLAILSRLILLAIVYVVFLPILAAWCIIIYHTVSGLIQLIAYVYSYLYETLLFSMFHCHVIFINLFVTVSIVWLVLSLMIAFNDQDLRLLIFMRDIDDEAID